MYLIERKQFVSFPGGLDYRSQYGMDKVGSMVRDNSYWKLNVYMLHTF